MENDKEWWLENYTWTEFLSYQSHERGLKLLNGNNFYIFIVIILLFVAS